ncbi:hypothetical protein LTR78_006184 [Recurvomyces mirabilis]|uniref:Rhodopsin domain-containing protein n=1 Tax=Recurvomyces mirabilis TaxID=574656 RepID=A0AAE0WLL5_9PEZI|nr:hypothetical protein LTR78_006184 [Recurvomyces mirabilis]KAK5152026.1 hypothetical protein LTS14_008800 [Recurvomyces mirabilis]
MSQEASALAAAIAQGQQANYPDVSRGPLLVRTVWVLISFSTITVFGRLYTKLRKARRLYWDDALVILALIIGIFHAAWITRGVQVGLGRHINYLSEYQRGEALRVGLWSLLMAFLSPMAGRMAFCVTLLYLAGTDPRVKKWPIWIFFAGQLLVNVAVLLAFYTQCGSHLSIFWTPTQVEQFATHCVNPKIQTDLGYFQGSFNTLTDAFLTALPAVLIEHTRLSLKSKIGLACLLCLSILAMIASIVKTYEARALHEILDYTYDLCPYVIWITIELNVVIIVASIPLMRPLFIKSTAQPRRLRIPSQPPRSSLWSKSHSGHTSYSQKGLEAITIRPESQENIVPQHHIPLHDLEPSGIVVTSEVSITYESSNSPYVHAALVGLVQGEIANPGLVQ